MRGPQRGAGVALVGVQARDLLFVLYLPFRVPHPLALSVRRVVFVFISAKKSATSIVTFFSPFLRVLRSFVAQGALACSARGPGAFILFGSRL
jgi:hypothetical protein